MEKWRIMLCVGNSELGEVDFKGDIFHRDSLSPCSIDPFQIDFKKGKGSI